MIWQLALLLWVMLALAFLRGLNAMGSVVEDKYPKIITRTRWNEMGRLLWNITLIVYIVYLLVVVR